MCCACHGVFSRPVLLAAAAHPVSCRVVSRCRENDARRKRRPRPRRRGPASSQRHVRRHGPGGHARHHVTWWRYVHAPVGTPIRICTWRRPSGRLRRRRRCVRRCRRVRAGWRVCVGCVPSCRVGCSVVLCCVVLCVVCCVVLSCSSLFVVTSGVMGMGMGMGLGVSRPGHPGLGGPASGPMLASRPVGSAGMPAMSASVRVAAAVFELHRCVFIIFWCGSWWYTYSRRRPALATRALAPRCTCR